jgi:P4 family phage/plasmid primase-like protien
MTADRQAIRQFIEGVHGTEPGGWLILWTRQDKATRAFDLRAKNALAEAVEYCAAKAASFDVYAATGLQKERPVGTGRGTEAGVCALRGLWGDVDIAGAAHKAAELPPTELEARSLIDAVGLEPSIVVRSGFGLQPYWLFKESWPIESDEERKRLKALSTRFQLNLRLRATQRGWGMDSTTDLCRVLRVPGTFNHKIKGDIRLVTAEYADYAYNLDDFEGVLPGVEDREESRREPSARPDLPPALLPPILDGCAWMRHCRDDAASLPEPEWYRMLTVVARCEDAERWAHLLSQAYPQYSRRETQRKLKQASGDRVAPVTCAYVQTDLNGARYCDDCLFRGNINSPIRIGRIDGFGTVEAVREREPATGELKPTTALARIQAIEVPRLEPTTAEEEPAPEETIAAEAAASQIEKYTDLGNARRFVARYRGKVLYCDSWGRWLVWDGMRWSTDQKLEVGALSADLIRSLYSIAKKIRGKKERAAFLRHVESSESHRALTAMIALAKADRAIAMENDDFDKDLWLFNIRDGTIDLRTGQLRPHRQVDQMTKLAPVIYDPSARCPNWLAFLDMIMLGRKNLVDFLKRAFGASLTGITSDKAMFILYGPGGDNGKSTMIEVFEMVLGDYAMRTPVSTFLTKREGGIPNDIARLRGARFVWAAESHRGARLDEALIKEMTGGDRMSARFMRGEFFEFMPAFRPWLATNHKPTIRGDAAIWRRLKLVPFGYVIPKEKQKKRHEVMAMFRTELPGILNWGIEGCLDWQRDGLGVPDEVIEATNEYEAEQDTFAMFLGEKCVRTPNATVLSLALYKEYKIWAEVRGEPPVTHKTFAALMSEKGFAKAKKNYEIEYSGVGLVAPSHYDTANGAKPAAPSSQPNHDDEGEVV